MKIEVGKTYYSEDVKGAYATVTGTELKSDNGLIIHFLDKDGDAYALTSVHFQMAFKEKKPSKPAHYDTAIDTIAFAKANFSREQVEGFMRINVIKYLQRAGKKDDKLSDLQKSAHYLQMLIEMEEGE